MKTDKRIELTAQIAAQLAMVDLERQLKERDGDGKCNINLIHIAEDNVELASAIISKSIDRVNDINAGNAAIQNTFIKSFNDEC